MLDRDLIAYYDAEATGGHRVGHGALRHELRARFAEELRANDLTHLVDVGAGPGLDTEDWQRVGFDVVGLDLAHENVRLMHQLNLRAVNDPQPYQQFFDALSKSLFLAAQQVE